VVKVTELDGSMVTYDYDELRRLTTATRTGTDPFSHFYDYGPRNNRTSFTDGGVTTTYTYDDANQLIGDSGGTSYSYDRNGNLTGYGSNTLTYDASNG
jgi:YD repeat-containing protein